MDVFEIGTAVKESCEKYFSEARQTGRTSQLIDSLNDGDRIVFINRAEASHWESICKEIEKDIQCISVRPSDIEKISRLRKHNGRTVFDNGWIEIFHMDAIHQTITRIDELQKELSNE